MTGKCKVQKACYVNDLEEFKVKFLQAAVYDLCTSAAVGSEQWLKALLLEKCFPPLQKRANSTNCLEGLNLLSLTVKGILLL